MSYRRLFIEVTGSGRGLEAALNRIDAGLGRTQSRVRSTNREMSLWERQIMAIGTTARYAFAGQFVFGVTSAIARLGDFTNKLGQVSALAGTLNRQTGQYTAPSQGFISGVGDEAIVEANKVGVATDDIQQYMQRFFSTFQVPSGNRMSEMRGFVDEVARLAAYLGSEAGDPQVLAGGIASFVNQIPGGRRHIAATTNRVANLISQLTAETPNIVGRDIARDIGRVGATMNMANMTPEEAFAVWGLAGKSGGSASVIGRGVAQLLGTSLMHPQSPAQMKAYQQVGLPTDPNQLAAMGGKQVLERMMERVGRGGNLRIRNKNALLDENVDDETALQAAGVSGVDRTLLYHLFGRQESVRQFINLMGQGGVRALEDYISTQKKATEANTVAQREAAFQKQNALTRFNVQRANLGLGLARGIEWPLEHIVAPPVGALANAVTQHRSTTQIALGALFGGLALRRGRNLFNAFRKRGTGATPGGELVGSLLAAESMPNVLSGARTDGTRANPYWVIIHPDSWFVGSPGGNKGFYDPVQPPGGAVDRARRRLPPIVPFLKRAPIRGIAGATAILAAPMAAEELDAYLTRRSLAGRQARDISDLPKDKYSRLYDLSRHQRATGLSFVDQPNKDEQSVLDAFINGVVGPKRAETLLEALQKFPGTHVQGQEHRVSVDGHAKTDVTIRLVDDKGKLLKVVQKKGIDMRLVPEHNAPTYKGKRRAQSKGSR